MTQFQAGVTSASSNRQINTTLTTASAVFATDWIKFVDCNLVAQLDGTATSVVAVVERSATDPAGQYGAHAAPADATGFTGDLTAGIAPNEYVEPGVGWWRINVTTVTGGECTASLSGIGS